jgi:hypothetical protein
MYRKVHFKVELDGKVRRVMAYAMNFGTIAPPCAGYENTIREGFKNWKLDESFLDDAVIEANRHYSAIAADDEDLDLGELYDGEDAEYFAAEPTRFSVEGDPAKQKGYDPFERWYTR